MKTTVRALLFTGILSCSMMMLAQIINVHLHHDGRSMVAVDLADVGFVPSYNNLSYLRVAKIIRPNGELVDVGTLNGAPVRTGKNETHKQMFLRPHVGTNVIQPGNTQLEGSTTAKMVLILSYQRCGSSFLGGLFDQAPKGLYIYEPLDGLYGAMYGIPEGWNVPGDIMNWPNGSLRILPEDESRAVTSFLASLLSCDYDSLPTEFLIHRFWIQFRRYESTLKEILRCFSSTKVYRAHGDCHKKLSGMCPRRFANDWKKQGKCHNHIWISVKARQILPEHIGEPHFKDYAKCMEDARIRGKTCIDKLKAVCHASKIRSTKTVRATMQSVGSLLEKIPNVKIIHLIRDPRAVVLSKKFFHSSGHSIYGKGHLVKEAQLFCQNVANDVMLRRDLEKKYPGTTMEVMYDKFVQDPSSHTKEIYQFINVTLTENVNQWIIANTVTYRNSTNIANKWQEKLTFLEVKEISKHCKQLFELVDYDWNSDVTS